MKIIGLKIFKQKIVNNKKGDILKFLSKRDLFFKKFGEVYFTEIKKNKTKGWNYHKKCHSLLSVPFGTVKFTFMDKLRKRKKIITVGKKNHSLIVLPPEIWFSFTSLEKVFCS